jgi:hypothetical protein
MIGIYKDEFLTFLQDNLGHKPKINSKNIVINCPWCEADKEKKHYHMYISLEAPIYHCFYSGCPTKGKGGLIGKLIKKIQGSDTSEKYIDNDEIKKLKENNIKLSLTKKEGKRFFIPDLNEDYFTDKRLYVKKRLKFQNIDLKSIHGLVFDIKKFVECNNITLEESPRKYIDYLQSNFIGFLTENHSVLMCRNIDSSADWKHSKVKLQQSDFLDYYKINGSKFNSNLVILAEGTMDVLNESIFDTTNLKSESALYVCALSAGYSSLLDSIAFNENIYRQNVNILSDRDVPIDKYKSLKYFKGHLIESLTVWYNRAGKDFAESPCVPEKFII